MWCPATPLLLWLVLRNRLVSLGEYRRNLSTYMGNKMAVVAPNLGALIGDSVAARLISHAGSLTNLAKVGDDAVTMLCAWCGGARKFPNVARDTSWPMRARACVLVCQCV